MKKIVAILLTFAATAYSQFVWSASDLKQIEKNTGEAIELENRGGQYTCIGQQSK